MSKGKRTISPDNGDDKVPEPYYVGEFRYRNNNYGVRYLYPPASLDGVSVEIQEEFENYNVFKELERSFKNLEIGGIYTAFQKTAPKPKSGGEEIDASDSKACQKRKKSESPANGGRASKEVGVFNATRSRRQEGGSSSNGTKGASSSGGGLVQNPLAGFSASRKSLNSSGLGGVGASSSNGAKGGSSSSGGLVQNPDEDSSAFRSRSSNVGGLGSVGGSSSSDRGGFGGVGASSSNDYKGASSSNGSGKFKAPPPSTRKNYTSRGEQDPKWNQKERQDAISVIDGVKLRGTTSARESNQPAEAQQPAPAPSSPGADGVGGEKNGLSPSQG